VCTKEISTLLERQKYSPLSVELRSCRRTENFYTNDPDTAEQAEKIVTGLLNCRDDEQIHDRKRLNKREGRMDREGREFFVSFVGIGFLVSRSNQCFNAKVEQGV